MNNQQNFYQQNFQQPAPQPRKPKSNVKWFVIGGAVLIFVGLIAYGATQLGKKFGNGISDLADNVAGSADSLSEAHKEKAYLNLLSDISADTSVMDSIRKAMSVKILEVKRRAALARLTIRTYGNGFIDTMQGKGTLTGLDKTWGHEYFITTGRAAEIKKSLLVLRDSSFNELPYSQRDDKLIEKIPVFELDSTIVPAGLAKLTSWEKVTFDQPVVAINLNLKNMLEAIRNYENNYIAIYRHYLEMQEESARIHP